MDKALAWYREMLRDAREMGPQETQAILRELCLRDLFFLLYHVLNRKDVGRQWLYERCLEVQTAPNNYLDLWAREHYKSTIITFGLTIQDILYDPEITFGIFSLNRPLAKDFMMQIKTEFEFNRVLQQIFPDVLYEDPQHQALLWNLDEGIVMRRKGNPKEATVEAWGLVEAMPTGKHFQIRLYDDIIDERNVTNPEMIQKATKGWELSLNLGSQNPVKRYGIADIARYAGTKYHLNDPYTEIEKRGAATIRKHPATDNGKPDGTPVFWSASVLQGKRRTMGPYVFASQLLIDPKADEVQGFDQAWLKFHSINPDKPPTGFNYYLLCDPASEKKKENDYTVIAVIGCGSDHNFYVLEFVRDRLNLVERTKLIIDLRDKYKPLAVGYEKYGKDSDIEHIQYVQQSMNYNFPIIELGGPMPKKDRIRKLIPKFEQGRFYLPMRLYYVDYQKQRRDLVKDFIEEEYTPFPVGSHDDMLDCFARILDPDLRARFPRTDAEKKRGTEFVGFRNIVDRAKPTEDVGDYLEVTI